MGSSSSSRRSSGSGAAAGDGTGSAALDEEEDQTPLASGQESSGLTQGYEDLVNAVIRPPRMSYNPARDLGPATFQHCNRRFKRQDLELTNGRGHKLACSWWKFEPEDAPAAQLPCVIYLHGNASCRLAAFELLKHLLPAAITVFALDFSGSGLSGGEYVSLGFFEREDVEACITYLRGSGEVSTVGLWGHSMGATTALLYGDRDPSIGGVVLDSAFADLMQLIHELGQNLREQGLRVPGFAISVAATMIRRSVRKRAKFDPRDVSPISKCDKSFIPALFSHGDKDAFIRPSHSEQLHAAYSGDKNLVLFDGDHNSPRPEFFYDSAVIFLRQTLGVKEEHCLDRSGGGAFDRGLFNAGAAVRSSEDDMMRTAMMMSIADTSGRGRGGGQQQPQQQQQSAEARGGGGAAEAPAAPPVPEGRMREAILEFKGVAGVGGRVAQFYVLGALVHGGNAQVAIAQYFDCEQAEPPGSWQPPFPQLLGL